MIEGDINGMGISVNLPGGGDENAMYQAMVKASKNAREEQLAAQRAVDKVRAKRRGRGERE